MAEGRTLRFKRGCRLGGSRPPDRQHLPAPPAGEPAPLCSALHAAAQLGSRRPPHTPQRCQDVQRTGRAAGLLPEEVSFRGSAGPAHAPRGSGVTGRPLPAALQDSLETGTEVCPLSAHLGAIVPDLGFEGRPPLTELALSDKGREVWTMCCGLCPPLGSGESCLAPGLDGRPGRARARPPG